MTIKVSFRRLDNGMDLDLPRYAHEGDSGMDVRAAAAVDIKPGQVVMVPCGFSMAIPPGYEAQLRPRSGLAAKHGISIPNSPGTIDATYRGPVCVLMINHGQKTFRVERGARIAQMVFAPVTRVELVTVAYLDETARGAGGFGSTGLRDSELANI